MARDNGRALAHHRPPAAVPESDDLGSGVCKSPSGLFIWRPMPTVVTTATPYCTARRLLDACDYRKVGDWAADGGGPRPTRRALLDEDDRAGGVVATALAAASGELEAAVVAGGKYSPDDLSALTGATRAYLEGLVAGLALWWLARRRNPASADPKQVPGAQAALDAVESLRLGERIFGLAATRDAAEMTATEFVADDQDGGRVVNCASRFFGNRTRGSY
jgi:hypothetical protein